MDDMDPAQEINEELLADALVGHGRRMKTGISRMYCEECGDPIPEARRKAAQGCTRCLDCQEFELLSHWRGL